jgi:hypothetical protein
MSFLRKRGGTSSKDTPGILPSREDRHATPDVAAARYDKLSIEQLLAHLDELKPADLTRLGDYERAHRNRVTLVAQIDARLGHEPWPGYDALDVDGVRFGLDGADGDRFVRVLAYELAHRNRAGVVLAAQQTSS